MSTLLANVTWDLVPLLPRKSTVGCWWVFTVKFGLNSIVDCLKSWLIAKVYTRIFGLHYGDTFSLVAKVASICVFLAMVVIQQWLLYQLDIKKRCIWSDPLALLLRGNLDWYVA